MAFGGALSPPSLDTIAPLWDSSTETGEDEYWRSWWVRNHWVGDRNWGPWSVAVGTVGGVRRFGRWVRERFLRAVFSCLSR